ncbi:23S rRNA (guanosine(2251)-2'-O)-methyltransferase RlmB [Mycoplasma mycoides]|uniref:23S rRNA (guanosine(2251)-2'-O)-methyltransferase RlmB n=1 Tax=Mycoplasma mycoides TaxID=2102 RepID=UPI00223ECB2D|nr:23S rRNA (guanosine(2251)-2'-O)-methyltransferase RlmB [Mycoplasma mycoides]QVK06753.1 23S rRNA (guanosine(2251)-2'-O)-methyltransferase RlmB [Mycoplasma mycoides subsp. capri]
MNSNLIYGKHVVFELLKKHQNMVKEIWVKDLKILNEFDLKNTKIKINVVSENKLDQLLETQTQHQGIIAQIKDYNYTPFNQLINDLNTKEKSLVLILDQIHDPYNFGAIIRSCSLLNVDGIIILDKKQVQVNSTVLKTSSGSAFNIKISKTNNLNNAIKILKNNGFWIYATNLNQNSTDMTKIDFASKTAVIIGNEQKGVSELLTKNSDFNIYVPSNKNIDSFNASVACSIICFWIANYLNKLS